MRLGRLVGRWLIGSIVGTFLIGLISPWFVRSYAARVVDPVRNIEVLPEGLEYRWRSEGYATTTVGKHGMMGRSRLPSHLSSRLGRPIIALWGDSQAEGVCVSDSEKLFAQLEKNLAGRGYPADVLPMAQSGQDVSDWIDQIPRVEKHLGVTQHWILLTEASDLTFESAESAGPAPIESDTPFSHRARIAQSLIDVCPDFVIHAARGLFLDSENRVRELRWAVGPSDAPKIPDGFTDEDESESLLATITRLRDSSEMPIAILYAPQIPAVNGHQVLVDDPAAPLADNLRLACDQFNIQWIDCRVSLVRSLPELPHGFHHGRWGSGHLNAVGNRVLSRSIAEQIQP